MVNEIIESIAKALKDYPGYEVYIDDVDQGISEPCFLLKFLKADRVEMLFNRVRIKSHFQIVFLAGTASAINSMAETLPFSIRHLSVNVTEDSKPKILALEASHIETHADQDEHTLVCLADYIYTSVLKEGEKDLMLTVTINTEVHNVKE